MKNVRSLTFYLSAIFLLSAGMLSWGSPTVSQFATPTPPATTPPPTPFPWARQTVWYSQDSTIDLTLILNASGSQITVVSITGRALTCDDSIVRFSGMSVPGEWTVSSTGEFQVVAETLTAVGAFQKDGKRAHGIWNIMGCQGSWTAT